MSKIELILALYDYNEWANNRLLKTASALSPEQFSSPAGASWGSIEASLAHILAAQVNWLLRWRTGGNRQATTEVQAIAGIDKMREQFDGSHAALREFIAGLSEDRLHDTIAFTDSRGNSYESVLWQLMLHVANHGTYHRGEVAMGLSALDHSPGDLDYRYFEVTRMGRRS